MYSKITHKHMMKRTGVLFLFLAIALQQSSAQSVYLHPSHEVYDFLKRMEGKHALTDYRDAVKPITRQEVARYLIVVDEPVSYTHLRAHETRHDLVCRLLL